MPGLSNRLADALVVVEPAALAFCGEGHPDPSRKSAESSLEALEEICRGLLAIAGND